MTYHLAGPWGDFFEEVRQYCLHEAQSTNNRMIWYAMLAMLRCISSMQKGTCKPRMGAGRHSCPVVPGS